MSEKVVRDHYSKTSETYGTNWVYTEDYIEKFYTKISDILNVQKEDVVVDMGCG